MGPEIEDVRGIFIQRWYRSLDRACLGTDVDRGRDLCCSPVAGGYNGKPAAWAICLRESSVVGVIYFPVDDLDSRPLRAWFIDHEHSVRRLRNDELTVVLAFYHKHLGGQKETVEFHVECAVAANMGEPA